MRLINSLKEVYSRTAEDCGISIEQVRFVIKHYEKALKKITVDPLEWGNVVFTGKMFRFHLKLVYIYKVVITGFRHFNPFDPAREYFEKLIEKYGIREYQKKKN